MEAKQVKDLLEAYSSIYEKKEEAEMEKGEMERGESEKDEGGKHKEGKHPKGKEEKGEKVTEKEGKEKEDEKEMKEGVSYSAKKARAGEDIGKPGKMFGKIAKEAGERYGSKERGEKVAGAVLAKLRKEEVEALDEAGLPYGPVGKGFKKLPAGKKREAMMKRADTLRTQAMKDDGDGGKGSPRGKMGEINDALKNPRLREETDIFDAVLEHLVAEGYADTNQAALAIMANMSEEWKQSIIEDVYAGPIKQEKPKPEGRVPFAPGPAGDFGKVPSKTPPTNPGRAEGGIPKKPARSREFTNPPS